MKKIITVIGARPQFVKAAMLSHAFSELGQIMERVIHTGQHYDEQLSALFFQQLNLPEIAYQLTLNESAHGAMTASMMTQLEPILINEKPDAVLVYGDTNSTLAGALTAVKLHIPVIHVEAGLRSFNRSMPEEINRIVTDQLSSLLFAPSADAINNLKNEGIPGKTQRVLASGDIMKDAVLAQRSFQKKPSDNIPEFFVLLTLHRAENTDDPEVLASWMKCVNELSKKVPIIMPIHPRTRARLRQFETVVDIQLIEPQGYREMMWLIDHAALVLTDSGGLQKEAAYLDTFCMTLRKETEWVELLEAQVNFLAPNKPDLFCEQALQLMSKSFPRGQELYGNGQSARMMAVEIKNYLQTL